MKRKRHFGGERGDRCSSLSPLCVWGGAVSYDLVLATVSLEASAERLVQLDPAERRRRAVLAARDYDAEGLWAIVEARLVLQGRAGARVSPRTLESYRQGLAALLRWAQPAGVSLLRPRPDEGSAYARWLEGQKYSPFNGQCSAGGGAGGLRRAALGRSDRGFTFQRRARSL